VAVEALYIMANARKFACSSLAAVRVRTRPAAPEKLGELAYQTLHRMILDKALAAAAPSSRGGSPRVRLADPVEPLKTDQSADFRRTSAKLSAEMQREQIPYRMVNSSYSVRRRTDPTLWAK
jgi:hypothetical protein